MNKKIYKILMIGAQGSGKGTQAQIVSKKLNLPVFSTGNILRKIIQENNERGKELKAIMNSGNLVPNSIVDQIITEKISNIGNRGYILDGYPRNLSQAIFLDRYSRLTHLFKIDISDEESMHRFLGRRTCEKCQIVYHIEYNKPKKDGVCDKCGGQLIIRGDETADVLKNRLAIYHKETKQIIKFYNSKNIVCKINGEQSINDVSHDILAYLN